MTLGNKMREMARSGAVQFVCHNNTLIITSEAWGQIISQADEMAEAIEAALSSSDVPRGLREQLWGALHPRGASESGNYYIKDGVVFSKRGAAC